MKKFILTFLIIHYQLSIVNCFAQTYQISFAGSGASSNVDSVQVQNLTQCKSISLTGSDILNLNVTTGINELSQSTQHGAQFTVFPNPMTDYCLFDFEATAQGETTISLFDIAGKRITQVQEFLIKGQHTYSLSGLNSGIYILNIESAQYNYSAELICVNLTSGFPQIKPIESALNVSHLENVKHLLKSNKSLINWQYTKNDTLKLTGFSGIYSTVNILIPNKNQTDTFNFIKCTDADSNHYAVVQIGTQIWMAENLKTTKYNDGTAIPLVTDTTVWLTLTTPAYCWYNDSIKYKPIYGALYNWYAVNTGKLCPAGWHVLDTAEWNTLTNYLGGYGVAGGKMKDACSKLWYLPNTGATNSSCFSAFPGGRLDGGGFGNQGYGVWVFKTLK